MKTNQEIIKNLRQFKIKSKWDSNHLFAGQYKSGFKGHGIIFKELREYQLGDDIRFIDWNVTARMQRTYTRVFEEEKETCIYILIDNSSSTLFGSSESKRDLITQLCADLCFSAIKNNNKTGLILFSDSIEKHIPPSKNVEQIPFLIKVLATMQSSRGKTNISKALEFINNIISKRSLIFIVSDFLDKNFEKPLGILANRHNVIGIRIEDKMDKVLPNIGLLEISDLETGEKFMIDSANSHIQKNYIEQFDTNSNYSKNTFAKARASLITLETGKDYHLTVQNFLNS